MSQFKKSTCKHFNGTVNECCRADVNYRQLVGGPDYGWARRLPCMSKYAGPDAVTCAKREEPTAEETAESEAEMKEHMNRFMKVQQLIIAMKKEFKGRSGQAIKTCPVCAGNLHMTIAGYNGHVHGRCETANCLAWME